MTAHIGIILAAGRGRRMGGGKQVATCQTADGPKALVAAAYDSISSICDSMTVVLGHDADVVAAALGDRSFHRVLADPDAPMFDSIRVGLLAASRVNAAATLVLQPGDHPEVGAATLEVLADSSKKHPAQAVIPQIAKSGGHPIFVHPAVAAKLVMLDCPGGLGEFWQSHPELCIRIPVDDSSVLHDVDTPADLMRKPRQSNSH